MNIVPDETIFGVNSLGESINYGYVRKVDDENELINLLRLRLNVFFINQVNPLQTANSAFPLTTMTCVGIETLGKIFITKKSDDTSHRFVQIIKKINQIYGRKPNKKYEKKLKTIWDEDDLKNLDCYGKIIYRFFRNSMMHGYQGRGVFLSYEDTVNLKIDDKNAFLIMNPNWFWESFKDFFNRKFIEIESAQENSTERQNCLKYIREYLLK
jgi:hypothetical protein